MAGFELSKWYLDCVSDDGEATIAYTGTARWGPLRLHYSSLLESTGARVSVRHSMRKSAEPELGEGRLRWRSGEWEADSSEVRETVYDGIEWRCLMPRARVRIGERTGLGYAEHIRMTVEPWKLPIRILRWGRFVSNTEWIVWIDWAGEFTRRIVYRNGEAVQARILEDDLIEFSDGSRLTMDRSLVLREGQMGKNIPGIKGQFPARLLRLNECKWRSRGRLSTGIDAWVIHEKVEWPTS